MPSLRVEKLLGADATSLGLELLAGQAGLGRRVTAPRIQKPGLALAGYTEQIHRERVQVLGLTELSYLRTLDEEARSRALTGLVALEPACIAVTRGLDVPPQLVEEAERHGVPLMRSPL